MIKKVFSPLFVFFELLFPLRFRSRLRLQFRLRLPLLSLMILLTTGCCPPKCENPCDLNNLQDLSFQSFSRSRVGPIRGQAIRDTALSVGARGGLACRASQINLVLLKNEKMLYRLFNFNAMLLDKHVLPPILIEGRNNLTLGGPDTIRIADRTFQIISQAKFVTVAPSWRDYIWFSHTAPETPDRSLLPRTKEERIVWKRYIQEGWLAGFQQAELIFSENISRLKRDFEGMVRYKTLLAQNMVSPPFVAEMEMGVTGGGSNLTVNDRIMRITSFPSLQADSSEWKSEIIPYE